VLIAVSAAILIAHAIDALRSWRFSQPWPSLGFAFGPISTRLLFVSCLRRGCGGCRICRRCAPEFRRRDTIARPRAWSPSPFLRACSPLTQPAASEGLLAAFGAVVASGAAVALGRTVWARAGPEKPRMAATRTRHPHDHFRVVSQPALEETANGLPGAPADRPACGAVGRLFSRVHAGQLLYHSERSWLTRTACFCEEISNRGYGNCKVV